MKAVTRRSERWNPFKEMEDLQSRLSSFFGNITQSPIRLRDKEREEMTLAEWAPLVDITEDDREYVIKAELPEVRKEDLKVTVEHGVLSISGERRLEKEEQGRKYHRVERAYGGFIRSFTLPDDADGSKVSAEFKNGLLEVRIVKSEEAKTKAIDIKVS